MTIHLVRSTEKLLCSFYDGWKSFLLLQIKNPVVALRQLDSNFITFYFSALMKHMHVRYNSKNTDIFTKIRCILHVELLYKILGTKNSNWILC